MWLKHVRHVLFILLLKNWASHSSLCPEWAPWLWYVPPLAFWEPCST